jgi:uncharacterized protein
MKAQIRLLGIDDGPFVFSQEKALLIGVVIRANGYLEGILKREVSIDGLEATDIVIDMINSTHHRQQLKAVLLDGVALGGFNVIDIEKVYTNTRLPVITVTRDQPNLEAIKNALKAHFKDWEVRFDLMQKGSLFKCNTQYNPIFIKCAGFSFEQAKEIITLSTIRGVIPEPIRMAHLIASGITRGESYGKA